MQLRVTDLGRVHDADLDIRPLTVLVGKNGTGKTWTAHAYFKLLERLRVHGSPGGGYSARGPFDTVVDSVADEWVEKIQSATSSTISLSIHRDELIAKLPDTVMFEVRPPAWTSTLGVNLPRASASLTLSKEELRRGVGSRLDVVVTPDPLRIEWTLRFNDATEPSSSTDYGNTLELRSALRGMLTTLLGAWRMRVRALPAERVNLTQIFPVLIRDVKVPMPRALVDFCYMLSIASVARTEPADPSLSEMLTALTGGKAQFDDSGQLVFRPTGAESLVVPIKAAASAVKSLAGLSIFLSVASAGDVLIIDEPEMNAHPETQVRLVELFAAMVRKGIHIVLATHSPYVLDHLSTLIETSKLSQESRQKVSERFSLGAANVYLNPEEVAVYQFETDGQVRSIFDRERGVVDWSTFTQVSERESETINAVIAAEVGDDAP